MITQQEVTDWAGLKGIALEDPNFAVIIPAVNEYVDSLPSINREIDGSWAGTTRQGAIMLAARWYQRRNSQAGIESVGEMTTYVSRTDSDISRLLNIDAFRKPMVY